MASAASSGVRTRIIDWAFGSRSSLPGLFSDCQIDGIRMSGPAASPNVLSHIIQFGLVSSQKNQPRILSGCGPGRGGSDAARCPRDDHDSAVDVHGEMLLAHMALCGRRCWFGLLAGSVVHGTFWAS
jgi:hypothetical protein